MVLDNDNEPTPENSLYDQPTVEGEIYNEEDENYQSETVSNKLFLKHEIINQTSLTSVVLLLRWSYIFQCFLLF